MELQIGQVTSRFGAFLGNRFQLQSPAGGSFRNATEFSIVSGIYGELREQRFGGTLQIT